MAPSTGFRALVNTTIDVKLLCLQRFSRLYAFGSSSMILALQLAELGISEVRIGLFMTLTLFGDVFLSLAVTAIADRIGRARMLALGSLLMASSGVIFVISNNYWILLVASIFGIISPRYVYLLITFNVPSQLGLLTRK
jgi:predicted MFS family arabinose efflux permease